MSQSPPPQYTPRSPTPRRVKDKAFLLLCLTSASTAILLLVVLLLSILWMGGDRLSIDFLRNYNSSNHPQQAGILPALVGSIWLMMICALLAIPLGVGTAILLEEYQPRHRFLTWLHGFVQMNITNLAGVPSIVYAILGVSAFAAMDMFGAPGSMNEPLATIGQRWFNEYRDVADNTFFTEAKGRHDERLPAAAGMVFYTDTSLRQVAEAQVLPSEELAPRRQEIQSNLRDVEETIRQGIEASRTSRRGPVAIDAQRAATIATDALKDVKTLRADNQKLIAITTEQLLAMDGMESAALRAARRQLIGELIEAELQAAGVRGLIEAGELPQRRDQRAWYYLQIPFGRSVLAGGMTLMLVVLPTIIVAAAESIRAVPQTLRQGSLALGSTKWQAIAQVVLPAAIPGICTGTILAMSRAIGEAAPIILLGAVLITYLPDNLMSGFSAMPLQIYQWTAEPDAEFRRTAAAGIIVLLAVLLSFNAVAIYIRQKLQRQY